MNIAKLLDYNFDNRTIRIHNKDSNEVYLKALDGYWEKFIFNEDDKVIYFENSDSYNEGKI